MYVIGHPEYFDSPTSMELVSTKILKNVLMNYLKNKRWLVEKGKNSYGKPVDDHM